MPQFILTIDLGKPGTRAAFIAASLDAISRRIRETNYTQLAGTVMDGGNVVGHYEVRE